MLEKLLASVVVLCLVVVVCIRVGEYATEKQLIGSVQEKIESGQATITTGNRLSTAAVSQSEFLSVKADRDDLVSRLDAAKFAAEQSKLASNGLVSDLSEEISNSSEAAKASSHQADELQKLAAALTKERDEATAKANQLTIDLVATKDELTKARAEALKESNKTCPTQQVVEEQNATIADLRKQLAELQPKNAAPPAPKKTKFQSAIDQAADSHRLVLAVFSQDKCLLTGRPCFRFERDVMSRPETVRAIENDYVLCDLNIDHDDTGKVLVHSTPAIGIYSPAEKKWKSFFAPNMSVDTFLGQLEAEKAELVK